MRTLTRLVVGLLLVAGALVAPAPGDAGIEPAGAATCQISTPSSAFAQQVATSPGHAQIWRLYQAFFLRQPDRAGFDYWYGVRARGASLGGIAYTFSTGPEFRKRYGNLGDGAFVDLVYRNVLCRSADASGRSYWLGQLRSGAVTRWDMVVNFAELREYLGRTRTCHSIHPSETAATPTCPKEKLVPLGQATLATHGYRERNGLIPRVRGGNGSFRAVEVDITRNLVRTGAERCSVASINANYVLESEKDRFDPSAVGLGLIDGKHVKGSADRLDRGVLGLRFDASPRNNTERWPGDTGTEPDRQRISSVLHHSGRITIDSWHATAEQSPYLQKLAPEEFVGPDEWVWAVAGVPLIINGQTNPAFPHDYQRDPYSNQTLRHSFLAFDKQTKRMVIGATADADVRDLVIWAQSNGMEELVKFDGGGSTEFNVARRAVVAGTPRDIPVWLGVGC